MGWTHFLFARYAHVCLGFDITTGLYVLSLRSALLAKEGDRHRSI